ncbi:MAG: hypothetical protein K2N34_15470 [Lachnospiraceae bacterium]|nr:hypothetical protein [Lachnospiraceae bacterium]
MMKKMSEFGIWLKTELLQMQMTQRELSRLTGINEKVINDLIYDRNHKDEHIINIQETIKNHKRTA